MKNLVDDIPDDVDLQGVTGASRSQFNSLRLQDTFGSTLRKINTTRLSPFFIKFLPVNAKFHKVIKIRNK